MVCSKSEGEEISGLSLSRSFFFPPAGEVKGQRVCHGSRRFKHAPLLPPFSEAKMEMILFLDFLSSGTDGSGRELWIADCESFGPPPWLLILTGGAGGLSSHTMLSHIYTGVHLHAREETRPMDGWVILVRKLHLGRVKDGGLMQLSEDRLAWDSLALIAVLRQQGFSWNYYSSDIFLGTSSNRQKYSGTIIIAFTYKCLSGHSRKLHNVKQSINKQELLSVIVCFDFSWVFRSVSFLKSRAVVLRVHAAFTSGGHSSS